MENIKIKIIIVILFILSYCTYSIFINTDIYSIKFPYKNDINIEYINDFHPIYQIKFIVSNPPVDSGKYVKFIIGNLQYLMNEYLKNDTMSFIFYQEKWFLNRFFSTLNLDDRTINEAIILEYGYEYFNRNMKYITIFFEDKKPYLEIKRLNEFTLLYFPFGSSKQINSNWLVRCDSCTNEKKIIFPNDQIIDLKIRDQIVKIINKDICQK